MNTHEEEFIKAFVEPSRQERFLGFVRNPKSRAKFVRELDHVKTGFLDMRYAKTLRGTESLPGNVYAFMRNLGAPEKCWAVGGRFDGSEVELLKALSDSGDGFVASCIPGKLAYLKSEDEELLLQR